MSWVVLLRPEAERDLADVRDWYRRKGLQLGDDFLDAVAHAMRRLEEDPKRERLYYLNSVFSVPSAVNPDVPA